MEAKIEIQLAFGTEVAGDFLGAREHAHRAVELAEPLGPEGGFAEALAVSAIVDYMLGGGLDEARVNRALELEDPNRQVTAQIRPSVIAGYLMLYEGRLADSVRILGSLRERILERGEDSELPFVSSYLAWAECWRGDLAAAAAHAEESLDCAVRIESEPLRCFSLAFAALPPAYAGNRALAIDRADECRDLADRVGLHVAAFWAGWALALVALAEGDPRGADAALAPFVPMFEAHGVPEPIACFFLPDAIEAMIATAQIERAERLLAMFEESARRLDRGWALMAAGRCRALLLSARGDLDGASVAAGAAVAVGEGLELRLEYARTLLVAGQIERRRRRKRAAREYLARSLDLFEAAGARPWAGNACGELERVVLRRAERDELTEAERRVAELAASGLTNREVAARLFISPKTVEAHLAHAYRKLDIHSRAALGARLDGGKNVAHT